MSAVDRARAAFDDYAAMPSDEVPTEEWSRLQVNLARWQTRNFGGATAEQIALGVAEEAGELCHAVLKASQGIRGMGDREVARAAVGDAIADVAIYAMQMATLYRLDFAELVHATAAKVMARDWKVDPAGVNAEAGELPQEVFDDSGQPDCTSTTHQPYCRHYAEATR